MLQMEPKKNGPCKLLVSRNKRFMRLDLNITEALPNASVIFLKISNG